MDRASDGTIGATHSLRGHRTPKPKDQRPNGFATKPQDPTTKKQDPEDPTTTNPKDSATWRRAGEGRQWHHWRARAAKP